jgi:hypothetical protein
MCEINSIINTLHAIFLVYTSCTPLAILTDINEYIKGIKKDMTEPGKPTLNTGYGPAIKSCKI